MEGKKRSQAWDFFDFMDDTKKKVKCKLCPAMLSFCGGTTTMNNHLERKHPSAFKSSPGGSGNTKNDWESTTASRYAKIYDWWGS